MNKIKYYTECIPPALAEKLKEKGMPMEVWDRTVQGMPYISIMEESSFDWLDKELGNTPSKVEVRYSIPTFASVFDWLMNEGVHCTVTDTRAAPTYEIVGYINIVCMLKKRSKVSSVLRTWHEAAEAAIEKALTLI